jgi:MscS family membrane protein
MDKTFGQLEAFFSTLTTNRHLQAAIILACTLLVAGVADLLLARFAPRIAARTRFHAEHRIVALLGRPISLSLLFIGCSLALQAEQLPPSLDFWTQRIILTLAVLVWLGFGIRIARLFLTWASGRPSGFGLVQPESLPAFDIGAKLALFGLATYLVLKAWNVDLTAWLASAGIIGIALGFAAKDTLANLFAGIFILADAPYHVGDFIVLDNQRGQVTKIGLRSTRILTRDDIEITIPNQIIANSKIINESGGPSTKQRLRVPVGVAYDSDIDVVRRILKEVAEQDEHVSPEPAPRVRFRGFGDSSLNFELLCWIDLPTNRGLAQDSLNTAIFKRFRAEGVEIPYPKRDLYIKQQPRDEGKG